MAGRILVVAGWLAIAIGIPAAAQDAAAPGQADLLKLPRTVEIDGLHNVYQVTSRLWSGSSPSDEAHFAALAKLGVRTIISVDGAIPPVAAAAEHGLRYVHLPVGYHGIERPRIAELSRAVRDLPGGVYVHCHHGKHRGPAAAAAVFVTLGEWTPATATDWMRSAGTSPDYRGLYATIRSEALPDVSEVEAVPLDLPAVSPPQELVDVMVRLDERWEELSHSLAAAQIDFPAAAAQALLLAEDFRELEREEFVSMRPDRFLAMLQDSQAAAETLQRALSAGNRSAEAVGKIKQNCQACHKAFRDQR